MIMDINENEAELDIDLESTNEDNFVETELEDTEATTSNKLQTLKAKLKACETEKMENLEQVQRAKADFLNARKRLEEERLRDRERMIESHVEELIPLYDSFTMAMSNKVAWEAIDKNWRVGVEGIFAQLQGMFASYNVTIDVPVGKPFDPQKHDALKNEEVTDATQHDTILNVVQAGFIRKGSTGDSIIRPARVIVGTFTA
jgi:molecular chaperone GrpE